MLRLIKPGDVVLDYSSWRPTKTQLAELKVKAVVRYIAPGIPRSKLITPEELNFLFSEPYPVGVLFVYEWQADRPNAGGTVGLSDGVFSREKCKEFGYPVHKDLACIFAIDINSVPTNVEAHKAYSAAFKKGLGPYGCGIYGDSDIIKYCVQERITVLNWLVGARSWGHSLEKVHVEQKVQGSTSSYDMNVVHIPFYVWLPSANDENQNETEDEEMTTNLISNSQAGKYGGAAFPQGGYSVFHLNNNGEKRAISFPEYLARGYPGIESKVIALSDADLDAIPNYTPVGDSNPNISKKFVFRGEGETN